MSTSETELAKSLTPVVKEAGSRAPTRRVARETALRAVYVIEMRNCDVADALGDSLVVNTESPPAYTVRLLTHVERYREHLDDLIRAKVEKWEFHRIAVIDRLILRLAVAELLYFPDVPPKVSINEAIEIAKSYSTDKSGRFVNGVLDAIFSDISNGRLAAVGNGRTSS